MSGYFKRLKNLKFLIKNTEETIVKIQQLIEKSEKRVEKYRGIIDDPQYTKDQYHPKFRAAEEIRQTAFYLLGETKYLLYVCNRDLEYHIEQQKYYYSLMNPLIS